MKVVAAVAITKAVDAGTIAATGFLIGFSVILLSLLPQLSLTLTNAIIATSVLAGNFFPQDMQEITPNRLGYTTGIVNMLLAPFGAFPMCHGAGGLVVQYRFGARSWLTPAIFGICMLSMGLALGQDALKLLLLLPLASVGALLLYACLDLA
jgi:hypothetical protein